MKDLNDLMQAILDMDATQRKAAAAAAEERTERLGRLDEERKAIAAEYAARAQASGRAAAAAADAANRAEWVAELVRRTLAQPRAGGEA